MNKNCALNLVDEIILYYDARSKKHQIDKLCSCFVYLAAVILYRNSDDKIFWTER